MIVWRITERQYAATPLDGEGSRRFGTRWNHPGRKIVSTSETLSLAGLERLVHFAPALSPSNLASIKILIPDESNVQTVNPLELPSDWRTYPAPESLARIGDAWYDVRKTLLLKVPSAVIPQEYNVLINAEHPAIASVRVMDVAPFTFDCRLYKPR